MFQLTKSQLTVDQMSAVNDEWAKANHNMLRSITDFSSSNESTTETPLSVASDPVEA
jgi:hypothetical protein